ncbi:MAG TPA: glycosyltransferase [Puia sp.]|jgi:glycosyltransferase involved in cell wall biosynthesis
MLNEPIISVIMPVYNGEKFLKDAIESILTQTFQDFEFIIINDGSTDNTEKIILSYNDPRIIYVKNNCNLKLIKTLNKGIELAKGIYIARMDADDISLPLRFEKQLEVFNSFSGVDIVNSNAYFLEENGKYYREQKSAMTIGSEAMKYLIPMQNFICHPAVMIKNDVLKKYKYLDDLSTEHIEDFDLWNRMLQDGCICYTHNQNLLLYRNNRLSINHRQKEKQYHRMYLLCNKLFAEKFDFKVDNNSLKILLGEKISINYFDLKKINKEVSSFNLFIKNKYPISPITFYEMNLWKKRKIVLVCLKSLTQINILKKIEVVVFLIVHSLWFLDKNVRQIIKRGIYTKSYKRVIGE